MPEGAQRAAVESRAHRVGKYTVAVLVIVVAAAVGYVIGRSRSDGGPEDEAEPATQVDTPAAASIMCTISELRERLETGEITSDMLPASWTDGQVEVDPVLIVDLRRLDPKLRDETEQDLRDWTSSLGIDIVPVVERCRDDFDPETDLLTR